MNRREGEGGGEAVNTGRRRGRGRKRQVEGREGEERKINSHVYIRSKKIWRRKKRLDGEREKKKKRKDKTKHDVKGNGDKI